jgi:UPF0271 protein
MLIDLNCDLGEGFPTDAILIPLVSSVNIACGGHAGDDAAMRAAVRLAVAGGANVGAHPGYEDRAQFGRVELNLPDDEIVASLARQVRSLIDVANEDGAVLRHVKPHGALYHRASQSAPLAAAIARAIADIDPTLAIVSPPASQLAAACQQLGLRHVAEGFVDRRYRPDGTLVPRSSPDAILSDPTQANAQALEIIQRSHVTAADGTTIPLRVETLCVHGDGPHAAEVLTRLRQRLTQSQITVRPFP